MGACGSLTSAMCIGFMGISYEILVCGLQECHHRIGELNNDYEKLNCLNPLVGVDYY
jgi:hypothetical protein